MEPADGIVVLVECRMFLGLVGMPDQLQSKANVGTDELLQLGLGRPPVLRGEGKVGKLIDRTARHMQSDTLHAIQ